MIFARIQAFCCFGCLAPCLLPLKVFLCFPLIYWFLALRPLRFARFFSVACVII